MNDTDPTQAEMTAWLSDLISQQQCRDSWLSDGDLLQAFDAYLDAALAARAKEETL